MQRAFEELVNQVQYESLNRARKLNAFSVHLHQRVLHLQINIKQALFFSDLTNACPANEHTTHRDDKQNNYVRCFHLPPVWLLVLMRKRSCLCSITGTTTYAECGGTAGGHLYLYAEHVYQKFSLQTYFSVMS